MTREKTYRITRIEKDKSRILVGFTPDICEIGVMIDEDRDKYYCPKCEYMLSKKKDKDIKYCSRCGTGVRWDA